MPQNKNNHQSFYLFGFLAKSIIFWLLIYTLLVYNIQKVWYIRDLSEPIDSDIISYTIQSTFDTTDEISQDVYLSVADILDLDELHASADHQQDYKVRLDQTCSRFSVICSKIQFNGEFSDLDKFIYTNSIIFILSQVDWFFNKISYISPIQVLNSISINAKWWDRRGFSSSDRIILNTSLISSNQEFLQVFVHELWHIIDLWVLVWISSRKHSDFTEFGREVFSYDAPSIEYYGISWVSENTRKLDSINSDFCSLYGMTNPFEDFAECFTLYVYHHDYFRHIASENEALKKKYSFLTNIMWWRYIFNTTFDYKSKGITYRSRDATRLR